jgi:hypothetical protein
MAAFEIDEKKLRRSLPAHDGEWWEGFMWAGAICGIGALLIGSLALFGFGVFRALF